MNLRASLIALVIASPCVDAASQLQQQAQPATYADVYAKQALGRVVVPADGKFILYEWAQPYFNWVPDMSSLASSAARRLQTFVYKVDLTAPDGVSQYLFYPNAGCTYWLSELSPDARYVVVYELDHDDHRLRVGAWSLEKQSMRWFSPRPDEGRIEDGTVWISNDEFVYPAKGVAGNPIKASVATGEAYACSTCSADMVTDARASLAAGIERSRDVASRIEAVDVPKDATLVTGASNGSVAIFVRDDSERLSLLYKKPDQPVRVLFENKRMWRP